jgi:putative transposase
MAHRLGWHNRGYLPHFDGYGAAQHVVFRTFDSLSAAIVQKSATLPVSDARRFVDTQLDGSHTGRIFEDQFAASEMEETLRHFDGQRFDLLAWCVMPNHIHVLIVPLGENRMGDIVRTWKMQATKRLGGGRVFAADYFDRYMRNSKQMETTLLYIEYNPVKAGLCLYPEQWRWSSASKKSEGWFPNAQNCPVFLS